MASWLPAPSHTRTIVHDADADATARVTVGDTRLELGGRAIAIHIWGRRRMPTLHWIYAPWIGGSSLEIQAISLRDRFAMGLATLTLDSLVGATGSGDARASGSGLHKRPSSLAGRRPPHIRPASSPPPTPARAG